MPGFIRAYCKGRLIEWPPDGDQWIATDKTTGKTGFGFSKDAAYLDLRNIKVMPPLSLITNVEAVKFVCALEVAAKTVNNKALKSDLLKLKYKLEMII